MYWFYRLPPTPPMFLSCVVRVTEEESPDLGDCLGTTDAHPDAHKAVLQALLEARGEALSGYQLTYEELPHVQRYPDEPAPEPDP